MVKYINEHSIPKLNDENRLFALSSNDKVDYIVSVLNALGHNVEIVSPTITANKTYYGSRRDPLNEKTVVLSGISIGWLPVLFRRFFSMFWLLVYLLRNTKKNEIVFSYHGVQKIPFVLFSKFLKRFKLVLEVEEIYADISSNKKVHKWRTWLENLMIQRADAYIFASKQLADRCNKLNKPFAIANGSYVVEPVLEKCYDDGKIHLVYAGLIKKNAVVTRCVDMSDYLSEKYILHIIGYGNDVDLEYLKEIVKQKNSVNSCKIIYDGVKRGDDYKRYLQKCHIGLCPLNSSSKFQSACFPSKITSYLANGLRVVTTDNEVVKKSSYGNIVVFCKNESPQEFASIIRSVDVFAPYDSRACIRKNEEKFFHEMIFLLNEL